MPPRRPWEPRVGIPRLPFLTPALQMSFDPGLPLPSPFPLCAALNTHHISPKRRHLNSKRLGELVILNLGSFKIEREKERMKYEPSHSRVL